MHSSTSARARSYLRTEFLESLLSLEPEPAIPAHDVAGGGTSEMGTQHIYGLIAVPLDKLPAGLDRELWISVKAHHPIRMSHLDRVVHHIAGDYGVFAA